MSSRPQWVDFHCHLDLYPDHQVLIAESDRERVATLTVTTTPKAWPRNRDLTANSTHVRVALGLHPQVIAERGDEVSLLEKYLPEARYVGEVGLDAGPRFYRSVEQQELVFERILCACSEQGGKILTVHSNGAVTKVLGQLEKHLLPGRGHVILHWFTGSAAEARRAVEYGCYFSINTQMLRSSKHSAVIAKLPIERLLTETDGPFVQVNGRAARPLDVSTAVNQLARIRSLPMAEMQRTIVANLSRLVST
jgi:TatD DNase family protein